MKKLTVYILFSLFLISCQNTERSVGFVTGLDGNEYKYFLGTSHGNLDQNPLGKDL